MTKVDIQAVRKRIERFRVERGPLLVPYGQVTMFVEDLLELLDAETSDPDSLRESENTDNALRRTGDT